MERQRKRRCDTIGHKVYDWGINDYGGLVKINGKMIPGYNTWYHLIQRCHNPRDLKRNPTYKDCVICEEWRYFSVFKTWFDEHCVVGYELDKDIIKKGDKVYSTEFCCFVPHAINCLFIKSNAARGKYPIGVFWRERDKCFNASCCVYGKNIYLGSFKTPELAFNAYKKAKEAYIKKVACQYFLDDKITLRVFHALMDYVVLITD